ncbi:hypothetical protein ABT147_44335 [Streptomyces sp. NPDC001868]|uniref:hypothetical protein n=1 Tax=Streptomyces sp. NPDC001868 TaxID=3154401 RepID=UPI003329A061
MHEHGSAPRPHPPTAPGPAPPVHTAGPRPDAHDTGRRGIDPRDTGRPDPSADTGAGGRPRDTGPVCVRLRYAPVRPEYLRSGYAPVRPEYVWPGYAPVRPGCSCVRAGYVRPAAAVRVRPGRRLPGSAAPPGPRARERSGPGRASPSTAATGRGHTRAAHCSAPPVHGAGHAASGRTTPEYDYDDGHATAALRPRRDEHA